MKRSQLSSWRSCAARYDADFPSRAASVPPAELVHRRAFTPASRLDPRPDLDAPVGATELGRPESHGSKVESGERRIDVVEFLELAEALGADPMAIVERVRAVKARRRRGRR